MSEKTFGERLVEERKRLGLSATQVMMATEIHRNTQSAYENDKKVPDLSYLIRLHHMGFDVLYLLAGSQIEEDAPVILSDDERLWLQYYRAMPPTVRSAALALAQAADQAHSL